MSLTLVLVLAAVALIVLDVFIPSGGLLSGTGIALLIERALDAGGVAAVVRWPLALAGMLVTVSLAVRYGERISEALFPARVRTNVDRLVGVVGRVRRIGDEGLVVDLEGDLWTARLADGSPPVGEGDPVQVVALVDQVPVVRRDEEGGG